MGQPHKGDRTSITLRVPTELYQQLRKDAHDFQVPLSQYLSDLLALQAGRPDLARKIKAVPV
ncbi:toxin-antitoxin system [Rhodococcus ruber]|uniref:toxin-antitoxin system n=1 Tax=Rhodococcus ruber TaxID=1830 RepID=UPI001783752F|nr:toxin-antitoxin system [Rhodococcus ruber]MBD8056458.1 toxin-antitoxin system [Rhodococcus ruber]